MQNVYLFTKQEYKTLMIQLGVIEYSVHHLSQPNEYFASEIKRAIDRIREECLQPEQRKESEE